MLHVSLPSYLSEAAPGNTLERECHCGPGLLLASHRGAGQLLRFAALANYPELESFVCLVISITVIKNIDTQLYTWIFSGEVNCETCMMNPSDIQWQ
jgi:hypothetical protein